MILFMEMKTMKYPLIAVTARDRTETDNRIFLNNESYYTYIQRAGGIPAVIIARTEEDAEEAAQRFDGLLITGGDDVDPAAYHEENKGSFVIAEDIERSDFLLFSAFKKAGKPILGICRGMQVIAVAEGAHLIQDIPAFNGHEHFQTKLEPPVSREKALHTCSIMPDTLLYEIFGPEAHVNSFHHQAAVSVPEGYVLSAVSYDGLIEGIEKDHITAVQWHPERMILDDEHLEIARRFVASCLI